MIPGRRRYSNIVAGRAPEWCRSGRARRSPSPCNGATPSGVRTSTATGPGVDHRPARPNKSRLNGPTGPGVFVFDPNPGLDLLTFPRHTIEDGGVAGEDAVAADLDGDGRPTSSPGAGPHIT